MRKIAALLMILLYAFCVSAQNVPTPITADNAATRLQPLSTIGSPLPVKTAFSSDGRYIIAATTDFTAVYPSDDLNATPDIYPFTYFSVDASGELLAGGKHWDLDTHDSVDVTEIEVLPPSEESPNVRIEIPKSDGEIIIVDTQQTSSPLEIVLNPAETRLAVVIQDGQFEALTLWLYSLPDGEVIGSELLGENWINDLFFTTSATNPFGTLMVNMVVPYVGDYVVAGYEGETGVRIDSASGESYSGIVTNADKSLFAYDLESTRLVIGANNTFSTLTEGINLSYETSAQLIVSGQHVVISESGQPFTVYGIDAENRPTEAKVIPHDEEFYPQTSFQGRWIVTYSYDTEQVSLWDVTTPQNPPRAVTIGSNYPYSLTVHPDGTRIIYNLSDNRRILQDTLTGKILADVPLEADLSPDWSTVAYWQHGTLVVRDVGAGTETVLEIIPDYIGRVADVDFTGGQVAFTGQQFQIFDLDNASPLENPVIIPTDDPVPHRGQFVQDGSRIIVGQDGDILSLYRADNAVPLGLNFTDDYVWGEYTFSPSGRYVVSYDEGCDYMYGNAFIYIVPFAANPDVEDAGEAIAVLDGCRSDSFAFADQETTLYATNRSLLRYDLNAKSPEPAFLLTYPVPEDNSEYPHVRGVRLSPDEQLISLGIEIYDEEYEPDSVLTEVFRVADLAPNASRAQVTPILSVPDARLSKFSPDGELLVTEAGLYHLTAGLMSSAINGRLSVFNPDSTILATYQDGAVMLWDVRSADFAQTPLAQYGVRGVNELGFSPDGSRLYVVRGGEVQVWRVEDNS